MQRIVPLLLFILVASPVRSQTDSLWGVWNDVQQPDSNRLKAMQTLAWKAVFEQPDSGLALAGRQLELAERVNDPRARYEAHTTMAVGNSMKSRYDEALVHLDQCLAIAKAIDDPKRIANTYSNMSNVHRNLGDLPRALQLLHQSLRTDEALNNKAGLAGTYNNIGNIHKELGEDDKALASYQRSAALYDALDDDKGRAQTLMNMGAVHLNKGQLEQASDELSRSIVLLSKLGRRMEMGISYNTLGRAYSLMGRGREAHAMLDSARTIFTTLGAKRQLARVHYYTGEQLLKEQRFRSALSACREGLEVARSTALLLQEKECLDCMMRAHAAMGDYRSAYQAQTAFMALNDSLARLNNRKETTRLEVTQQFQERMFTDSLRTVRQRFEREQEYQAQLADERDRRNLFVYSSVGVLLLAGGLWSRLRTTRRSRAAIQRERDRSDELLLNILPATVAQELKDQGYTKARHFEQVTVLFSDFKGFTSMAEKLSATELIAEIDHCFKAFDAIMDRHAIEKIKTIGDAYMAAAGLPDPGRSGAVEMVQAALEMQQFIAERHRDRSASGQPAFQMRIGLHSGPVVAGVVGVRKFAYDIWGDTVNTAARMESSGEAGQVNLSADTYALVKDATDAAGLPLFTFSERGHIQAKGKGELLMYFVSRGPGIH